MTKIKPAREKVKTLLRISPTQCHMSRGWIAQTDSLLVAAESFVWVSQQQMGWRVTAELEKKNKKKNSS